VHSTYFTMTEQTKHVAVHTTCKRGAVLLRVFDSLGNDITQFYHAICRMTGHPHQDPDAKCGCFPKPAK
jgi:hypothetical protein